MKGRSKDSTRTLVERILAGHRPGGPSEPSTDVEVRGDGRTCKVDQLVLGRMLGNVLGAARAHGDRTSAVEVAVAYPPECISWDGGATASRVDDQGTPSGLLIAQPGAGFAPVVHLERFAAPGRVAVVDDPRLAVLGAMGMLTLVRGQEELGAVLRSGSLTLADPVSVLVAVTGRLRPFVSVRDAGLQLIRSAAREVVQEVQKRTGSAVILEFGGQSTKHLSVPDRAVLASIAPRLGAQGVLFPADDKTETFLRDQRRSKAFRAVAADGASYEAVVPLDLGAVDPLVLDASGEVLPVRLLEGKPIGQALLGGDSGTTLRDLYTVGSLLKGKRSPGGLEFLFAPPSRQCLEVLTRDGVLLDLIALGARIVEPDRRVLSGECYPPLTGELSVATFDPVSDGAPSSRVAVSCETLAFALVHGQLGDPRGFRRQVRVALPRQLPTEDTLLLGGSRRDAASRRGRPSDIDA